MIAKIAVSAANFAIDKPYSYYIPQGMEILPGTRVMVPFGRSNRHTEGVVLGVEEGMPIIEADSTLEAMFICPADSQQYKVYYSKGFDKFIK